NFTGSAANQSVTGNVSDVYYYDYDAIPAGTYYWKMYANDSAGNWNQTFSFTYIVTEAATSTQLYLNNSQDNFSAVFGYGVNVTGVTDFVNVTLYLDGVEVNASSSIIAYYNATLAVGHYNFTAVNDGNENYSISSETWWLNVTKATPVVDLLLNGTSANFSINQTQYVNMTGLQITGDEGVNLELYLDGDQINTGTSPLENITQFNNSGTYNMTLIYPGSDNYTAGYETWWIQVNDTTDPTIVLYAPEDQYNTSEDYIVFNFTATNSYATLNCTLYIDGSSNATNATTPNGSITLFNTTDIEDGTYYWNMTCIDGSENSNTSETRNFTIDTVEPSAVLNRPPNNAVDVDQNITFNCSTSDDVDLEKVELYINEVLNQTHTLEGSSNETLFSVTNLADGEYNWSCMAYDWVGNTNETLWNLTVNLSAAPAYNSSIFNGTTTDWNSTDDITNVCNGTAILDAYYNKVQWYDCVNAENADFDTDTNLSYNHVEVTFGLNTTFNSTATITIRNLTWDATPLVEIDGELCDVSTCSEVDYNVTSGVAVFNVTHFTVYTTVGNSKLGIWDETDTGVPYGDKVKYENQQVEFYANYTKKSSGAVVPAQTCIINFTDGGATMTFYSNATTNLSVYSRSFSDNGTYDYNITCSASGYQTITLSDNVTINETLGSTTLLYLNGTRSDFTSIFGEPVNLTAVTDAINVTLYIDGDIVNESSSTITYYSADLAVGYYNITAVNQGNATFYNSSETWWLNVTKAAGDVNLLLNGTSANFSINQTQYVNITGLQIAGDDGISLELYEDGTLINTGTSPLENITQYNASAMYNITLVYPGSDNYTATYETWWISVNDTTAPNWTNNVTSVASGSVYDPAGSYQFNVTWQDNVGMLDVLIEHNFTDSALNYTLTGSNISDVYYYDYDAIPAGTYYWKMYANDSAGNWNETFSFTYIVTEASGDAALYLNGSQSNFSINQTQYANITGVLVAGDAVNIQVYEDGTLVTNTTSPTYNNTQYNNTGMYNITLVYPGTRNYTSDSETWWIQVNDTTAPNWTNNVTSVASGSAYDPAGSYQFNVTWQDNVGVLDVLIEHNFTGSAAN
ncbi:hypothetical protein ACFL96_19170, partial [Thermoproteota archaeon]